jgi:trimethylamine:corrinoid methyltransferase-like protein
MRANDMWKKLRDRYVPPFLDPAITDALDAFTATRREELGFGKDAA